MNDNLHFSAVVKPCFDFVDDEVSGTKTVVIAPIVIQRRGEDVVQVGYACSRGLSCLDEKCRYSKGTHQNNQSMNYVEPIVSSKKEVESNIMQGHLSR